MTLAPTLRYSLCKPTPLLQVEAPPPLDADQAIDEEETSLEELLAQQEAVFRKDERAKTRAERRMRRPLEQQFSHTRTYQP
jgi:hypothetical protein